MWGELRLHPESHPDAKWINPILQRVWDSKDRVSWVIARVILQELGMTVPQFCRLSSDLKPADLHHLLRSVTKVALQQGHLDKTFSTLVREWDALATANPGTPLEAILKDGAKKITEAVLKQERTPLARMFRSWRFRAHDAFESSWADEYRQFRKAGQSRFLSLSFDELISVAKGSSLIPPGLTGKALWDHPVTKEARKAYLAEATARQATSSTAELVMRLEFSGYGSTAESWRDASDLKAAGLTWNAARDIVHFDPVAPEAAEPVLVVFKAKKLFPRGELNKLREDLARDYQEAAAALGFSQLMSAEFQRLGVSTTDIAQALAIPQPSAKTLLPGDCVRLAIAGTGWQRECSPGALALFAARSEPHFHELLSIRRREIVRELTLRRGAREPSALKIERSLWGVGIEQLSFSKRLIENLEWGRRSEKLTPEEERKACEQVRQIGLTRARNAFHELLARVQLGSTSQTIDRLVLQFGGLHHMASVSHASPERMERFRRGEEIPPLPLFRDILAAHGVPWGATVLRRWYLDVAERQELLQPSAAARCLLVEILSRSSDPTNFLKSLPTGSQLDVPLRRILRGVEISPDEFAGLLEAFGIERAGARHSILVSIAREQDTVRGVHEWLVSLPAEARTTWMRAISDLATVVKADLNSRRKPSSDGHLTVQELISLHREGRFSRDLTIPPSVQDLERPVLPVMELLAGLSAREVIALVEYGSDEAARKLSAKRPHAHRALRDKLSQVGLTPLKLAPILAKNLVEQGHQAKQGLLNSIQYALNEGRISAVTPFAVLAALVAQDPADFEVMLSAERERIQEHGGGRLSAGAIEAQLWGVHPKDLADTGIELSDPQAAPRARALGLNLCEGIFKEIVGDYAQGVAPALVKACMYRSELIGQEFSRAAGVKSTSMSGFLRGERTLEWSRFAKLINAANVDPGSLVKVWWQFDMAQHLKNDPQRLTDRQRVTSALLHEGDGNLASLLSRRFSKVQVHEIRRVLRCLEDGKYSSQRIVKVFKALRIPPQSHRGIFLNQVFQTGSIESGINEVLRSHARGRRSEQQSLGRGSLQVLQDLLSHESSLMQGVENSRPQIGNLMAFRAYFSAPLDRRGKSTAPEHLVEAAREAFPGVTREELRAAFEGIGQGAEATLTAASAPNERGWESSLSELRRRLGSDFDSVEVDTKKKEIRFGKDLISADMLSDALFGINRATVRAERVNIMRIRMTFDLPVFHPGDHTLMLDENVPIDGSQPEGNEEEND
jgi:hypothetical protein